MRKVRRNDTVLVLTGKDRGKTGVVRSVDIKADRMVVDGINMMKKHQRPSQQGGVPVPGGVVVKEAPIHASNLMLICKTCGKPTRPGLRLRADGAKVRICKRCNADID